MKFASPFCISPTWTARFRSVRNAAYVAALLVTVLALAGAVAVRVASPTARTDLVLVLVAAVTGSAAAVLAVRGGSIRSLRRILGGAAVLLLAAYAAVAFFRPPELLAAERLFDFRSVVAPTPVAMTYAFRETSSGLGAKLPWGNGWSIDPVGETTLQASGEGMHVRVESTPILPHEELGDVADRLLSELAASSHQVADIAGFTTDEDFREGVLKEIEVWTTETASESRLLAVFDDGSGTAVVVWMFGSPDVLLAKGIRFRPTLATATLDPQRLAEMRREAAAAKTVTPRVPERNDPAYERAQAKGLGEALEKLRFRGRRFGR